MTDVETLLAIEAIKRLKARYFRCIDTKDWSGFGDVFVDDVHFDIRSEGAAAVLDSPQAIVEMVRTGLSGCVSVHHGHCPEITITSDTTADGIWAMEDLLRWEAGDGSPIESLHGYGHYRESYRKVDGAWRIQTMTITRLRVDTTPWPAET